MIHYSHQKNLQLQNPKPPYRPRMRRLLGHDPLKFRAIDPPSIQFHFDFSSYIDADACGTEISLITILPPYEHGQ